MLAGACALALLFAAAPLLAQTFGLGEIILSGSSPGPPFGVGRWRILWLDANWNLKGVLYDQPFTQFAGSQALFGPGNVLYAVAAGQLLRIQADGTTSVINTPSITPSFFTIAANGDLYVGGSTQSRVLRLNAAGQFLQSFDVGSPLVRLDLASDQCTLYYTSHTAAQIQRLNVCTGESLTPFTSPDPGMIFGYIRLIPGGLLHSTAGIGAIGVVRRNEAGQIVQTYPGSGFVLALDIDGTSFWTVGTTGVLKVDIATGSVVRGPFPLPPQLNGIFSIAVVGEPRAAVAAANAGDVPTLSIWMLLILLLAVASLALLRVR